MLSFRSSCKTAYDALHETAYDDLELRSSADATEMADRREDKYKKMDSLLPEQEGGRLIRSKEEQEFEVDMERRTRSQTNNQGETFIEYLKPPNG